MSKTSHKDYCGGGRSSYFVFIFGANFKTRILAWLGQADQIIQISLTLLWVTHSFALLT